MRYTTFVGKRNNHGENSLHTCANYSADLNIIEIIIKNAKYPDLAAVSQKGKTPWKLFFSHKYTQALYILKPLLEYPGNQYMLNDEIWRSIFSFLDPLTIMKFIRTCFTFYVLNIPLMNSPKILYYKQLLATLNQITLLHYIRPGASAKPLRNSKTPISTSTSKSSAHQTIKVLLVGPEKVGKTTLITQLLQEKPQPTRPTAEISIYEKPFPRAGKEPVLLHLYDTPPVESSKQYQSLLSVMHAVLLVCDVTTRNALEKCISMVTQISPLLGKDTFPEVYVVFNKMDLCRECVGRVPRNLVEVPILKGFATVGVEMGFKLLFVSAKQHESFISALDIIVNSVLS